MQFLCDGKRIVRCQGEKAKKRAPNGALFLFDLDFFHCGDVGVDALIPVSKTGNIDLVAHLQQCNLLVSFGFGSGQIHLYTEAVK